MEIALLVFGVAMACIAAALVIACLVSEASEAWDIARRGWVSGHHQHHALHHR